MPVRGTRSLICFLIVATLSVAMPDRAQAQRFGRRGAFLGGLIGGIIGGAIASRRSRQYVDYEEPVRVIRYRPRREVYVEDPDLEEPVYVPPPRPVVIYRRPTYYYGPRYYGY